eukprot:GHVR01000697.1.p1 GENE.GHVR01000697.1~~GHVR01000697.1.p1  ORF type:complete len:102 (-),score=2.53 GHVR01000697.1:250-555(-)
MKPLQPLRSASSNHYRQTDTIVKSKSSLQNNKPLTHLLKYDEVGLITEKGQRFTDRIMLGKSNLMVKITGMTVYINQSRNSISGLQCIYNRHKKGGEYMKK